MKTGSMRYRMERLGTYGFPVTPLLVKDAQYAVKDFAPKIRTGSKPLALISAMGIKPQ